MVIDIALLPQAIQTQILAVEEGQVVQFANNGQIIGELTQKLPKTTSKLIGGDKVFGILQGLGIDGLEYERQIRSEWVREWEQE